MDPGRAVRPTRNDTDVLILYVRITAFLKNAGYEQKIKSILRPCVDVPDKKNKTE